MRHCKWWNNCRKKASDSARRAILFCLQQIDSGSFLIDSDSPMSPLPHSIELHDSTLAAVVQTPDAQIFCLRPAYIHHQGKGWKQDADICLSGSGAIQPPSELPSWIGDGSLTTARRLHDNLLELPLQEEGPVTLNLLLTTGEALQAQGTAVSVVLHGQPRFVEDVPF